jgi:hypothetical protein
MPDRAKAIVEALAALRGPAVVVTKLDNTQAASPGLYAFHASAAVWTELGLGAPTDTRPVYVGKAESTLAARDVKGHFGMRPRGVQSPTGSSTLRRSLAALLAPGRGYRAIPRNPEKPGHFSNYGLSLEQDDDLSCWMRDRLRLALWPHPNAAALDAIETAVLAELAPPLNIEKVVTSWREQVKAARKVLAQQAREWRPTEA